MKIIIPKQLVNVNPDLPLFFLAGPVRGGGDWQAEMCRQLNMQMKGQEFYVVLPCRYSNDHSLRRFFIDSGEVLPTKHYSQTDWERDYLEIAGLQPGNCIIFWLACENKENPRGGDGPYARDTYGELGEWRGRMIAGQKVQMVIGGSHHFPGLEVIRKNFIFGVDTGFEISYSIDTTVAHAIAVSRSTK